MVKNMQSRLQNFMPRLINLIAWEVNSAEGQNGWMKINNAAEKISDNFHDVFQLSSNDSHFKYMNVTKYLYHSDWVEYYNSPIFTICPAKKCHVNVYKLATSFVCNYTLLFVFKYTRKLNKLNKKVFAVTDHS